MEATARNKVKNRIPYSTKWWQGKTLANWQLGNFKNLVEKTLANCNELSLSSSINTHRSHNLLHLKPQLFIMCSTKMVHTFAVSSVARE